MRPHPTASVPPFRILSAALPLAALGLALLCAPSAGSAQAATGAPPPELTCPDDAAMQAMAASLLDKAPVQPFGRSLSLRDGLCAQGKLVEAMKKSLGETVGWKVGLTNPAAQKRFGTDHPVAGPIYAATVRAKSGATLPAQFSAVPVIEADLIVRVKDAGINQAGDDPVEILKHIDQVIPFIEMPDLALADLSKMNGPNLVAIGVGARLGVVGEPIVPQATEDFARRLAGMTVILEGKGQELARAPGTALLGHPLNPIPWLVKELAARGTALHPGDLISLGGFSPALPAEPGLYKVTYDGLLEQPVSVTVTLN
ncbi:2-keto-4-pentenoate hydratase [Teichococcus oryzae]|uniref:Fumarylacetoacetate hydrolase n=1 Tax=Teichococcus oryzae TaxID=1608942 RepID=A0A5B2TGU6_9PROT|nr:fumarylacetoacetate hydrolase [Pseudoroseomonas oryzae]KAA2213721.1 fumarylacetoacetate hydrolase [Pseudoroseomonas oryzae]